VQPYANLSGNSGVVAYRIGTQSIAVKFKDGNEYLYTYGSAGPTNIETMKKLAAQGKGLSAFISTRVRNLFEKKI